MTVRMGVKLAVHHDRTPQLERAIRDSLEEVAREAAREYLARVEERRDTQSFPGPPLSRRTMAKKRAVLELFGLDTSRVPKRWDWLRVLIADASSTEGPFIMSSFLTPTSAKAEIMPDEHPEGRTAEIIRNLEEGGIEGDPDTGEVRSIPARPIWTTVARMDYNAIANRALRTLNRRLQGVIG